MSIFSDIGDALAVKSAWGKIQKAWSSGGDKDMALSLGQVFKSKTVWAAAATGALNIWQAVQSDPNIQLSPNTMTILNAVGVIATVLFRRMNTQKPGA